MEYLNLLKDIDSEMKRRDVEAVIVFGDTTLANPDLMYVVGSNLARGGIYFKRGNCQPLLLTSVLDVQNARKGKVKTVSTFTDYGFEKLIVEHGQADAYPRLILKVLKQMGVAGKVVIAGRNDLASGTQLIDRLRTLGVKISGEFSPTILEVARETKSAEELREIRGVGNRTTAVVEKVLEKLKSAKRRRGHLVLDRELATVGTVKRFISTQLAIEELAAPEGTIFAIGRSSADPHNSGIPSAEIKERKLIVFDIFPQSESGYWFDLTRTFVIGRADRRAHRLFEAVEHAQDMSIEILKNGLPAQSAMSEACDVIEKYGFKTVRDIYNGKVQKISSGFIHSLGHGVGLTIGERPYLSLQSTGPLKTGNVVTVEPGVYLPKYGGVRIEDTVQITANGCENLSNTRKEFELN
ncbi:MAG: Xaa-Pro peptidase family protein [Candidatus Bathyarchaeia archaeon]